MTRKKLTTEERIETAKSNVDNGVAPQYAIAHALIAIAELLQPIVIEEDPIVEWPEP